MYAFSTNSYITLRSNAGKDLFSDNNPYSFANQLCTTLNYSYKTKVALAEIHLPLNFRIDATQKKLRQIYILSDLVDDSIIGSSRLNILKVLSVDTVKSTSNCQVELFQNLFFYHLNKFFKMPRVKVSKILSNINFDKCLNDKEHSLLTNVFNDNETNRDRFSLRSGCDDKNKKNNKKYWEPQQLLEKKKVVKIKWMIWCNPEVVEKENVIHLTRIIYIQKK